jgi:hypothetical protein
LKLRSARADSPDEIELVSRSAQIKLFKLLAAAQHVNVRINQTGQYHAAARIQPLRLRADVARFRSPDMHESRRANRCKVSESSPAIGPDPRVFNNEVCRLWLG